MEQMQAERRALSKALRASNPSEDTNSRDYTMCGAHMIILVSSLAGGISEVHFNQNIHYPGSSNTCNVHTKLSH